MAQMGKNYREERVQLNLRKTLLIIYKYPASTTEVVKGTLEGLVHTGGGC